MSRLFKIGLLLWISVHAAAVPLQFAPYDLKTDSHGTQAAEIAWLDVPARHAEPNGAKLRLRVVRLVAPAAARRHAPIIYFAGGPGGSGVGTARGPRWPIFDRMRQHGDLLLLDQRGTGESSLPPECPHQAKLALGREALLLSQRETAQRCIAFWRAQGVDLAAYNTIENAHDVNALRVALAVPKLRLWGMSYGTHLASSVLRLHGAHIERAILMGYEGPNDTFKLPLSADHMLQQFDAMALRDDALAPEFRPLLKNINALLTKLETEPLRAKLMRSDDTVVIGKFEAQLGISVMLIRADFARHLPLAIGLALQGDGGLLGEYVHGAQQSLQSYAAMPLAMDIASGVSADRLARINIESQQSVLGGVLNFPYADIRQGLDIPDLGEDFRAPLVTAVPTLFVTGTLDVRTPPSNVTAALPGFANASELLIMGAGHDNDLWLAHAGIADTLESFLRGDWQGKKQLQAKPTNFATSMTAELWLELRNALGLPLIGLILLSVVALPVLCVRWWRKRRQRKSAGTHQLKSD
jgi:pimeloyl-ACP methyl ester carboxylesterase